MTYDTADPGGTKGGQKTRLYTLFRSRRRVRMLPPSFRSHLLFAFISFLGSTVLYDKEGGVASADPCAPTTQQSITVDPSSATTVLSVFKCEGGNFDVTWSGIISVQESIVIGNGTTVSIVGNHVSDLTVEDSSDSTVANSNESSVVLTTGDIGPVFLVRGGTLNIEGVVIRGGNTMHGTEIAGLGVINGGGGISAEDASVTVTGCTFENNFADWVGGGLFANRSRVEVRDSAFRECKAGDTPVAGEVDDVEGEGGGVWVEWGDLLVDNCLFYDNFASKKGAGVNTANGKFSVVNSIFLNNSAGSNNEKDAKEIGEGGDIAIAGCVAGFDNMGACGANKSVFTNAHVAGKGGSVQISSGTSGSAYVEIHGCSFMNASAGRYIEDDPQGDGGTFSVGKQSTLVVVDTIVSDSYAGNKGGVLSLSSGDSWSTKNVGGIVIMMNSTFQDSKAHRETGGVVYCNIYTVVNVTGDDNGFFRNVCGAEGGVVAASEHTKVVVEGGNFTNNSADEDGGVISTQGELTISGGQFVGNEAEGRGGVFFVKTGKVIVENGIFDGNKAGEGAVGFTGDEAALYIDGGNFSRNIAGDNGGVFFIDEGTTFAVKGGEFIANEADFGGFLYKKGSGDTSCVGVTIEDHLALDGGAIYLVDVVELEWKCDLVGNTAFVGPAIYARDDSLVTLQEVALKDNVVSRGSVVFLVSSELRTDQVVFNDSSRSADISAVQADEGSTYTAEDTSFVGFMGEAVIYNEGILTLDGCDFSRSSASALVFTGNADGTIIRNAILGDDNYAGPARQASVSQDTPNVDSIINVNLTCTGGAGGKARRPCSTGSLCMEGDLGVYCACYERAFSGNKTCISEGAGALSLTTESSPNVSYHPELVEGLLSLTLPPGDETAASGGSLERGVVWNASAFESDRDLELMNWIVFPATGLLLPGETIKLHVVSRPSVEYDGTAHVTFRAEAMSSSPNEAVVPSSPAEARLTADFYHCRAGNFWVIDAGSAEHETCKQCKDVTVGDQNGLNCSAPGASTTTLPVMKGYWRADMNASRIRQCFNQDACEGGSDVQSIQDYCAHGYTGPFCAVCQAGYGRGVSNACHRCSSSFKAAMIFVITVAALVVLVVAILLGSYLVGGVGAVTSTISSTKTTVAIVRQRGSSLMTSSISKPGQDWESISSTEHSRHSSSRVRPISLPVPRSGQRGALDFASVSAPGGTNVEVRSVELVGRDKVNQHGQQVGVPGGLWDEKVNEGEAPPSIGSDLDIRRCSTFPGSEAGSRSAHSSTWMREHATGEAGPGGEEVDDQKEEGELQNVVRVGGAAPEVRSEGGPTKVGNGRASVAVEKQNQGGKKSRLAWLRRTPPPSDMLEGKSSKGGKNMTQSTRTTSLVSQQSEEEKVNELARKVGGLRTKLPLSKLKIVIVVWQISSTFSEITQVPFPPVYKKFLSIVGVFTFDLGWIFSASCINTRVNFYHKLLIVTIGPVLLLSLLGATFYFGSLRARAPTSDGVSSFFKPQPTSRNAKNSTNTLSSEATQQSFAPWSRRKRAAQVSAVQGTDDSAPSGGRDFAPALDRGARAENSGHGEAAPADNFQSTSSRDVRVPGSGGHTIHLAEDHVWGLFSRHTTITLVILYLIYSSAATMVFQTFACQPLPEIDKAFLLADLRIECDTPEHRFYKAYSAVMIILYPLGIPVAFLHFLTRQGSRINPPVDMSESGRDALHEKMEKRLADQSVAPTSFLWLPYFPERYYYEVCECIRRLLLTGILVFVAPYTTGQVAVSCMFAFGSLLCFEYLQPLVDPVDAQLYRAGCLVIFMSNFFALMIKAQVSDPYSASSTFYAVALIVVHTTLFLCIWWNAWAAAVAVFNRKNTQDVLLGFEIFGVQEHGDASGKANTKDLETLEAAPAWERNDVSTLSGINSVTRVISTRSRISQHKTPATMSVRERRLTYTGEGERVEHSAGIQQSPCYQPF